MPKPNEIYGDDLGTDKFLASTIKFHWVTIPFLKDLNCAPISYLRTVYYPKDKKMSLMSNVRMSTGLGLNFKLSPQMGIMFYYNVSNPIIQKHDYPRTGFGFNITIF